MCADMFRTITKSDVENMYWPEFNTDLNPSWNNQFAFITLVQLSALHLLHSSHCFLFLNRSALAPQLKRPINLLRSLAPFTISYIFFDMCLILQLAAYPLVSFSVSTYCAYSCKMSNTLISIYIYIYMCICTKNGHPCFRWCAVTCSTSMPEHFTTNCSYFVRFEYVYIHCADSQSQNKF